MPALRIVFAGSPRAAVPSLRAVAGSVHTVAAVVTRHASPQGRNRTLTKTPVADEAHSLKIPVIETNRLDASATVQLAELQPDLGVIVAYGGLVREPLLTLPKLGWINLHFSLLPRWRGAAPVQRAIAAGDDVTGASVFQLVEELDAGPVFGTVTQSIGRQETAGHLLDSLAMAGAQLLATVIDGIADGSMVARKQSGDVTFAPKLVLEDAHINWRVPASVVHNQVRSVTPEPGAFSMVDDGRFKILECAIAREAPAVRAGMIVADGRRVLVGTATDPLELIVVQPSGRKPMAAMDWWRGRKSQDTTSVEVRAT